MEVFKNIIKGERAVSEVLDFEPRRLELDLSDSAKVYLNEDNRKKSDFVLSELIAQQTGVADVESQAHKEMVEQEVLEKLKEIQEKTYKEAYSLGQEEGSKAAFEAVKGELDAKIAEFSVLVEQMQTLRTQILKAHERELVELVFQVGKKIALKEIKEDSSFVKQLLETILQDYEKDQEIKVYLSEVDAQFINQQIESGAFQVSEFTKLKFVVDKTIKNGGCRVQTEFGSIDSQVDQRVDAVWESLKSRMPRSET